MKAYPKFLVCVGNKIYVCLNASPYCAFKVVHFRHRNCVQDIQQLFKKYQEYPGNDLVLRNKKLERVVSDKVIQTE
jgi:hypothetical protein